MAPEKRGLPLALGLVAGPWYPSGGSKQIFDRVHTVLVGGVTCPRPTGSANSSHPVRLDYLARLALRPAGRAVVGPAVALSFWPPRGHFDLRAAVPLVGILVKGVRGVPGLYDSLDTVNLAQRMMEGAVVLALVASAARYLIWAAWALLTWFFRGLHLDPSPSPALVVPTSAGGAVPLRRCTIAFNAGGAHMERGGAAGPVVAVLRTRPLGDRQPAHRSTNGRPEGGGAGIKIPVCFSRWSP